MTEPLQHTGACSHVDTRPLPLKQKDPALVAALTALQGRSFETEVGHETWRLRFSGKPGPGTASDIGIDAQWQGHRIAARIPRALLERTLAICLPEVSLRDIPDELLAPTACNLIGMWLKDLPHADSLRIADIAPPDAADRSASKESSRIHLLACRDAIEYSIALDFDAALLSALPSLLRGFPSGLPDPSHDFSQLPLPLDCEIGRLALPYATLKKLRLGDILFFDGHMEAESADPSAMSLQLAHRGHPVLRTRLHSPDLMVVTDITMNDRKPFRFEDLLDDSDSALFNPDGAIDDFDDDDDDDDALPNPASMARHPAGHSRASPGNLDQLPLQLVFDVGECEMRLSELQALHPGSVIPLASCRTDLVRIRVNGSVIASGELVEIDGKVGVMLARLAEIQ